MEFILNENKVQIDVSQGATVLDFIRYRKHLRGTKIGCREGDCGACTILVGSLEGNELVYKSMTSCLMPLANAAGKHIVTIEGLNLSDLSPVQQAVVDEGGTQCGFCTVGFVVSLTGYCLDDVPAEDSSAIASMDGNICRCTGYKSLERAASRIAELLKEKQSHNSLAWLVDKAFIPPYFLNIQTRLSVLAEKPGEKAISNGSPVIVGGGTDLYVQRPESMVSAEIQPVFDQWNLKGISQKNGIIQIGASSTAEDINQSEIMKSLFPALGAYMKLVSSKQIRHMGTLAGNLVNASPIGDLTIFFLALDSKIILNWNGQKRSVYLKDFYKGYKQLDLSKGEFLESLQFDTPEPSGMFNFEKVCKRTHLDIASVNSACLLNVENGRITKAHLSAGGVAPIPKFLKEASSALVGKEVSSNLLKSVNEIIQQEVSPISDARGSSDYKRLLLRQLFYAHFIKWFPDSIQMKDLID